MESKRRYQELFEAYIEGEISPSEHSEFIALLKENPQARQLFVDHMKVHGMLQWHLGQTDENMDIPLGYSDQEAISGRYNTVQGTDGSPKRKESKSGFLGKFFICNYMAAALLIVSTTLLGLILHKIQSAPHESTRPYVALLKEAVAAEWEGDSSTAEVGARIRQGDFTVHAGLVELELFDGAVIAVEGPSRLKLLSTNRVALEYGNLGAVAGDKAVGFEVETPAAKLVDRGTRFGVRVDAHGTTEMEVFSGKVDISLESDGSAGYRANELNAVRIKPGDARPSHIPPGLIRFPKPSQKTSRLVDGSFENVATPGIEGMPTESGYWSGDPFLIVGTDEGITPMTGNRMLKFVATSPPAQGPDLSATRASQQLQFIDVQDLSEAISNGQASIRAWAYFNRVTGDVETDIRLGVAIYAMRGEPEMARQMGKLQPFRLGYSETEILTDGDPTTWQRCEVRLLLPQGIDYVMLEIRAVENVFNNPSFPEFDGHYADDVGLELRTSPIPAGTNAGD